MVLGQGVPDAPQAVAAAGQDPLAQLRREQGPELEVGPVGAGAVVLVVHSASRDQDQPRIETVGLSLPGLELRVRASDVRPELRALQSAIDADAADFDVERSRAALCLVSAAMRIVGGLVTVGHLEAVVREAEERGERRGRVALQEGLRHLLGIEP